MSEENKSFFERLFVGSGETESREKVRQYVSHRLKSGAHLQDVIQEEYVQRNCTQDEVDEIVRDPRLVHQDREGLEQYFESEDLKPKHPPRH